MLEGGVVWVEGTMVKVEGWGKGVGWSRSKVKNSSNRVMNDLNFRRNFFYHLTEGTFFQTTKKGEKKTYISE